LSTSRCHALIPAKALARAGRNSLRGEPDWGCCILALDGGSTKVIHVLIIANVMTGISEERPDPRHASRCARALG
jgi:hypothetical protein